MKINKSGFSLIELLVALSILAVVAAIIVPRFLNVRENAAQVTGTSNLSALARTYKQFVSLGGTGSTNASDVVSFLSTQPTVTNNTPQPRATLGTMRDSGGAFGSATVALQAGTIVVYGQAALTSTSTAPNTPGFLSTATNSTTAGGTLYYSTGAGDVWTIGATANGGITAAALIGNAPNTTTF